MKVTQLTHLFIFISGLEITLTIGASEIAAAALFLSILRNPKANVLWNQAGVLYVYATTNIQLTELCFILLPARPNLTHFLSQ